MESASSFRARAWDQVAPLVAPLILVLVAAYATLQFAVADQPSWKGGSFGMFAHVDDVGNRLVVGELIGDGPTVLTIAPRGLGEILIEATVHPSQANFVELAARWEEVTDAEVGNIWIWRTHFDADTKEISFRHIAHTGSGS